MTLLTHTAPGYRHVYLEGIEEASIFVHVAVSDISGKVSVTPATSHRGKGPHQPLVLCTPMCPQGWVLNSGSEA